MAEEEKKKGFFKEFKEFISKGNVLDLAVGVIIGGAFNVIVTALVNILLSLATFWIPGGLAGLVYALPAVKATQIGPVGQSFANNTDVIREKVIEYAEKMGATAGSVTPDSESFTGWMEQLMGKYELHGGSYYFKGAALVDIGAFINAIITFVLIALTLFVIVKVAAASAKRRAAFKAKLEAKNAEEAPAEEAKPEE